MATKTLYVGNLPYSTTESQLISLFSNYGSSKVRIIEGRGIAFVDVDEDKLALAIQEMKDTELDGRTLNVSEARPREENSGNRYGGGRQQGNAGYSRNRSGGGRGGW